MEQEFGPLSLEKGSKEKASSNDDTVDDTVDNAVIGAYKERHYWVDVTRCTAARCFWHAAHQDTAPKKDSVRWGRHDDSGRRERQ
ncbi:MAG: hypothetical protein ACI81O_002218 [Cyclobacteriaceae bacterium]|jgi:hypothetical protein